MVARLMPEHGIGGMQDHTADLAGAWLRTERLCLSAARLWPYTHPAAYGRREQEAGPLSAISPASRGAAGKAACSH
jgi:hypothetical protein